MLGTEEVYEFYHIVETNPPGYHSTDVQAGTASLRWQGTATEERTLR